MENKSLPRLGILALMLEDYLPLFDGIREAQEGYVRGVLEDLAGTAEFVFPHPAMNRAEIENLVREYNHMQLDGILIFLLTYAQGMYVVHAMQDNRLPLALALIQPEQTVRRDFIEWDYTVNQGIHGSQDVSNCLMRTGANCVFFAGNRHGEEFRKFVGDFGAAAKTRNFLRNMKLGVIGKLPAMGDVFTDDMAVHRVLGPELVYDSIGKIQRYCAEASETEIDAVIAKDREIFEIDETLPSEVHREADRMYLGLKHYAQAEGLAGYTLHYGECGEDGRFTQLPLLASSHMLADGYGYAAEGDAQAAILVAAMDSLCGRANFSEMYFMDFEREAILLCHQGEGNYLTCRKDKKPYLKNRVLSEGGLSNPPTPIFTPEPGRAAVLSLVHVNGDHFRIVCAPGEIRTEEELLHVDMPYMFFRPDSGVAACVKKWLESGGTHHEAIVQGEHMEKIGLLCRLLGVELVIA